MQCLNAICERISAQIVICSSWRLDCPKVNLLRMLNSHGFVGTLHSERRTPGEEGLPPERGSEIRRWLAGHSGVTAWFVIEDSPQAWGHPYHPITDSDFSSEGVVPPTVRRKG